jgi:hypothetical protein
VEGNCKYGKAQKPRGSAFEVTDANGTVYWSKLNNKDGKTFPQDEELVKRLKDGKF